MKNIVRAVAFLGLVIEVYFIGLFLIDPTLPHFIIPMLIIVALYHLTRLSEHQNH
jgi:hypothetical protein